MPPVHNSIHRTIYKYMTWNKKNNTHSGILGGFSNAFSVLPLKSMKTQPRASDESKYGGDNIRIDRTGAQGSLEEPPALLQRLPEVTGQELLSLADVSDPQRV